MDSIRDAVSDVTPRERAELDKVLREGEYVRWAVRPQVHCGVREGVKRGASGLFSLVLMALALALFMLLGAHCSEWSLPVLTLMLLSGVSFLAAGISLAVAPFLRTGRHRRTLCVLTNHRALVQEPERWCAWKWNHLAFPLHEHMLRSRVCRPGGGGDLLFEGEKGFVHLPDLQEAQRELNAAIHALQDAAERRAGAQ